MPDTEHLNEPTGAAPLDAHVRQYSPITWISSLKQPPKEEDSDKDGNVYVANYMCLGKIGWEFVIEDKHPFWGKIPDDHAYEA